MDVARRNVEWSKRVRGGGTLLILDLLSLSHPSIYPFLFFLSLARALQKISSFYGNFKQKNVGVVTYTCEMANEGRLDLVSDGLHLP